MKMSILVLGAILMNVTIANTAVKGVSSLTEQQKGIIQIAAFATNGNLEKLKVAVDEALDSGLSVNEAGEVFLQLYAYAGFPRSLNAQNVLSQTVTERENAKKKTILGVTPSPVTTQNRYDIGREQINKIFGYSATQTRPTSTGYSEATDIFLKEHLFADIIQRDNLSVKDRELATVAILSTLLTVNSQLKSHINGALTIGNSEAQLNDLIKVLEIKVGKKEAKNARNILDEVLNERENTNLSKVNEKTNETESSNESKTAIPDEAKVSAFPVGSPNEAFAQYFVGNSFLASLNKEQVSISNVTFEPGCRNNWHVHHGSGQILVCVGGSGWYQEWEKPAQKLNAGDVVNIQPGIKHWHGATSDSWFAHLSLTIPGEGHTNEWLEKVSDEEYSKLK